MVLGSNAVWEPLTRTNLLQYNIFNIALTVTPIRDSEERKGHPVSRLPQYDLSLTGYQFI